MGTATISKGNLRLHIERARIVLEEYQLEDGSLKLCLDTLEEILRKEPEKAEQASQTESRSHRRYVLLRTDGGGKYETDPYGHQHRVPETHPVDIPYLFTSKEEFEEAASEWGFQHHWTPPR